MSFFNVSLTKPTEPTVQAKKRKDRESYTNFMKDEGTTVKDITNQLDEEGPPLTGIDDAASGIAIIGSASHHSHDQVELPRQLNEFFYAPLETKQFKATMRDIVKWSSSFKEKDKLGLGSTSEKNIDELQVYWNKIELVITTHANVIDFTELLAEAGNMDHSDLDEKYYGNSLAIAYIINHSVLLESAADMLVRGFKKNGLRQIRELVNQIDPQGFLTLKRQVRTLLDAKQADGTSIAVHSSKMKQIFNKLSRNWSMEKFYCICLEDSLLPAYSHSLLALHAVKEECKESDILRVCTLLEISGPLERTRVLNVRAPLNAQSPRHDPPSNCKKCGGTQLHWIMDCPDRDEICTNVGCGRRGHKATHHDTAMAPFVRRQQ
jgi:hypothetical protein